MTHQSRMTDISEFIVKKMDFSIAGCTPQVECKPLAGMACISREASKAEGVHLKSENPCCYRYYSGVTENSKLHRKKLNGLETKPNVRSSIAE